MQWLVIVLIKKPITVYHHTLYIYMQSKDNIKYSDSDIPILFPWTPPICTRKPPTERHATPEPKQPKDEADLSQQLVVCNFIN